MMNLRILTALLVYIAMVVVVALPIAGLFVNFPKHQSLSVSLSLSLVFLAGFSGIQLRIGEYSIFIF